MAWQAIQWPFIANAWQWLVFAKYRLCVHFQDDVGTVVFKGHHSKTQSNISFDYFSIDSKRSELTMKLWDKSMQNRPLCREKFALWCPHENYALEKAQKSKYSRNAVEIFTAHSNHRVKSCSNFWLLLMFVSLVSASWWLVVSPWQCSKLKMMIFRVKKFIFLCRCARL